MTRKRFSEEDILNILRQVKLDLAAGSTVESATQLVSLKNLRSICIGTVSIS